MHDRDSGSKLSVTDALARRRSVRAFLDRPVDLGLIETLLERAARAPSGGNLQPWHVYVLAGGALERLKAAVRLRVAASPRGEGMEYDVYPKALAEPYASRRFEVGEAMYAELGISREDREARRRWFAENYKFFGAPMGLFCFVHRDMGPPQWSDLGMFLQSFMLLLVENGLASCPQESWSFYPGTVSGVVGAPADLMLFCGVAIGYPDETAPVNRLRTRRAPLKDFATVVRD